MHFNKDVQYALLFGLYLCGAGRATTKTVSENLGLSKSFLEQVAMKLRKANVLKSVRGPGGGYELVGNPTVGNVFQALDPVNWLNAKEVNAYAVGGIEQRALLCFARGFNKTTAQLFKKTLRGLCNDLTIDELHRFDKAPITSLDS